MATRRQPSIGPLGKIVVFVLIFTAVLLITGSLMGFDLAFESLAWLFGAVFGYLLDHPAMLLGVIILAVVFGYAALRD